MYLMLINLCLAMVFSISIKIFEVIAKGAVYGLKMRARLMSL